MDGQGNDVEEWVGVYHRNRTVRGKGPPRRGTGGMKRRNSSKLLFFFWGGGKFMRLVTDCPSGKWLNKDIVTKTRPSKSCSIVTLP